MNISLLDNRNKLYIVTPSYVLMQLSSPFIYCISQVQKDFTVELKVAAFYILFVYVSFFSSKCFFYLSTYSCQLVDGLPFLSFVVLGTIRSAVGSAQLLISQKFEQFRGLCNENLVSGSITSYWISPDVLPFFLHVCISLTDPIFFHLSPANIICPTHTDTQKSSH